MANRRNLKKDINYLTNEILTDCYTHLYLFPEKNDEKILDIITKTVNARNEFISKINNPKLDNQKAKQYFKNVIEEVITHTNNIVEELQSLNK